MSDERNSPSNRGRYADNTAQGHTRYERHKQRDAKGQEDCTIKWILSQDLTTACKAVSDYRRNNNKDEDKKRVLHQ
ncbi:hypothetical protein FACS1894199_17370 [Bacteroidia bacterium]|nr:hypothetical protein FACS1894199_17370 [Bacteroidia bacterium]